MYVRGDFSLKTKCPADWMSDHYGCTYIPYVHPLSRGTLTYMVWITQSIVHVEFESTILDAVESSVATAWNACLSTKSTIQ